MKSRIIRYISIITLLSLTFLNRFDSYSQEGESIGVVLNISVKDGHSGEPIPDVLVEIQDYYSQDVLMSSNTDFLGTTYFIVKDVEYGLLVFKKEGYGEKSAGVDLRAISLDDGYIDQEQPMQVTLFPDIEEYSARNEVFKSSPSIKFRYDLGTRMIVWDTDYLMLIQSKVDIAEQEYRNRIVADSLREADFIKKQQLLEDEKDMAAQRYQTMIIAGVAGVFLIFMVIFLRNARQRKKTNALITEQHEKLALAHSEIQDSISYAKRIQSAILPPSRLVKENLKDSFVLYKPKDVVAGDFYWLEKKGSTVYFAAADCTGHGVPGAMVSVVCNGGLNRSINEFGLKEPGQILDKTRELVIKEFEKSEEEVKDGMDIALCALDGHSLKFAGAHNPLWIIRKGWNEVEQIKACKQPIGKFAAQTPFRTHQVELNSGDTIYIFSDGFADQFGGEKGKKFKAANFKKLLLSIQSEPMSRQLELIDKAFNDWKGKLEQIDDVCVMGVRV